MSMLPTAVMIALTFLIAIFIPKFFLIVTKTDYSFYLLLFIQSKMFL